MDPAKKEVPGGAAAGNGASSVSQTAHLTVTRRHAGDIGQREVFVALDGDEFAILRHGDSVTRSIDAGPHLLRIHNTLFWKKIPLDLRPGDHPHFNILNRSGWGTYAIASVLGAGPIYLEVEREG